MESAALGSVADVATPATSATLSRMKVTGAGRFPGDYAVAGCLFGAVVRSTVTHARVKVANVADLRVLPGVRAVVERSGMGLDDRVRQVGDVVIGIVAESESAAIEAATLARVRYDELPGVFEAGLADSCGVLVDERFPNNVVREVERQHGDVESSLRGAAVRHRAHYRTSRAIHFNLSTRYCVATCGRDGRIDLLTSADAPYFTRKELAEHIGEPEDHITIRVAELPTSSFGGRTSINPLFEPVAVWLAKQLPDTPVALRFRPDEELTVSQTRHPLEFDIDAAVDAHGRLCALDIVTVVDHGPYPSFVTDVVLANCRDRALDLFAVDNYRFRGKAVLTNNVTAGEMRGIGVTQVIWAVGCHLDELARIAGREPLDFIVANLASNGPAHEETVPSGARRSLVQSLAIGAERMRATPQASKGAGKTGWGVAVGLHTTGLGTFHGGDRSTATVTLNTDGELILQVAAPDSGQGAASAYSRLLADALGTDPARIRIAPVDTETAPYDRWGSVASRGVFVVGSAVLEAARALKDELHRLTASSAMRSLTLNEAAAHVGRPITVSGNSHQSENPPTFGACFAEVCIDETSGLPRVTRVISIVDVGHAIDSGLCHAQLAGAVATGWEFAVGSELALSDGRPLTFDPHDYRFVHVDDLPNVETVLVEQPEPSGPLGARGIGTPAVVAVAPAICNAIRSAVGYRPLRVPVQGEDILRHLVEAEAGATVGG